MPRKHRFESKALQFTYERYIGGDRQRRAAFEEALAGADIARQIYELRIQARLTQAELAALVGTSAAAISRLESADYNGHSLAVLRRIAAAVDRRVEVTFVPLRGRAASRTARRSKHRRKSFAAASRRKAVA